MQKTVSSTEDDGIYFDYCNLIDYDPWPRSIEKIVNPLQDPLKSCIVTTDQLSRLEKGQLFINPDRENVICQYRCLYSRGDYNLTFGQWREIDNGTRPKCDILEVECRESLQNRTNQIFYKFLHSQIYRRE